MLEFTSILRILRSFLNCFKIQNDTIWFTEIAHKHRSEQQNLTLPTKWRWFNLEQLTSSFSTIYEHPSPHIYNKRKRNPPIRQNTMHLRVYYPTHCAVWRCNVICFLFVFAFLPFNYMAKTKCLPQAKVLCFNLTPSHRHSLWLSFFILFTTANM